MGIVKWLQEREVPRPVMNDKRDKAEPPPPLKQLSAKFASREPPEPGACTSSLQEANQ
ncbi:hypothetical protein MTHERMOG20_20220 [Moorella thermoacetica]|nr:hypothetical protein MTHERMOG20_20220 [Moorella thermoacetica]